MVATIDSSFRRISGYEIGHSCQQSHVVQKICLLDRVDLLERKGVELSRATNWAYWTLGRAYRAFCEVGICPIASLLRSYTEGTKLGVIVLNRADCLPNYANLTASWFERRANGAETLCRTACHQPESMCIWWTYSGKRFSMRHP